MNGLRSPGRLACLGLLALLSAGCRDDGRVPDAPAETRWTVQTLRSGLDIPSEIRFAPDDTLYILERGRLTDGEVVGPALLRYDVAADETHEISGLPEVELHEARTETFNGGALGFAFHPDHPSNGLIYICYHRAAPENPALEHENLLSSFVLADDRLSQETVILGGLPGSKAHNGCRVVVGPDRKLYFTTGDGEQPQLSRDPQSRAGKILRLDLDGEVPADNPFPGSLVFSIGHRNPQGLAFAPDTGTLWSTEHGASTNDELNRIEAAMDYGWPECRGTTRFGEAFNTRRLSYRKPDRDLEPMTCTIDSESYRPAILAFSETSAVGISDLLVYPGGAFPEWKGDLLIAMLRAGRLVRIELDDNEQPIAEHVIADDSGGPYGRFRDVAVDSVGRIYAITNRTRNADKPWSGLLLRMEPEPAGLLPVG